MRERMSPLRTFSDDQIARTSRVWRFGWFSSGILILILTGSVVPSIKAAEPSLTEQYFDGLRSMGLFKVAEDYATMRLAEPHLSPSTQTELSIELARTLVDHGILSQGNSAHELQQEAFSVLDKIPKESSAADRLKREIWKKLLQARTVNAQARLLAIQSEKVRQRRDTVNQLRALIAELKSLHERLQPVRGTSPGLAPGELLSYRQRVAFAVGESLIRLAELSEPTESESVCKEARRMFDLALHGRHTTQWRRRVELRMAQIARLTGEERAATRYREQASSGDASPAELDDVLAEQLRFVLASNYPDEALQLAVDRIRTRQPMTDELRLAVLETLLATARVAESKQDQPTQEMIITEARRQFAELGGFPRKIGAILLNRIQQDFELGIELAEQVRRAAADWDEGDPLKAAEGYGAASQLAEQRGQIDAAFEFGHTQASILLQQKKWEQAEKVLSSLISRFPSHDRIAEVDLLRSFALGQMAPGSEQLLSALRTHVSTYPDSPTRSDALMMLAGDAESRNQIAEAIAFYRQIPSGSVHSAGSRERSLLLVEQQLRKTPPDSNEASAVSKLAEEEIRRIVPHLLTDLSGMSLQNARLLVQSARVCLQCHPPLIREASQILDAIQRRVQLEKQASLQEGLSPEWADIDRASLQLRVLTLATADRLDEAGRLLRELSQSDPDVMVSVLSSLTDMTANLHLSQRKELGKLQRLLVQEIAHRDREMSPERKRGLDLAAIQASIAMEDWPAAIDQLESLLKREPENHSLRRNLIDITTRQGGGADLKRALELWQEIERQSRKGSVEWIEARINIAELMEKTGDAAGARKILGVTRTLYPQLGSPGLRERGNALWERVQSAK